MFGTTQGKATVIEHQPHGHDTSTPPSDSQRANRVLMFIVGIVLGLLAQVIIIPFASFLALAVVDGVRGLMFEVLPNGGTGTLSWVFISLVGLVIEALFAVVIFVVARSIRQMALFQGALIGIVLSFLVYSGCWALIANG